MQTAPTEYWQYHHQDQTAEEVTEGGAVEEAEEDEEDFPGTKIGADPSSRGWSMVDRSIVEIILPKNTGS